MVLVEAAMFGRPLISCEIGTGTSFVNAHGQTGFVVPPEDAVAMAHAMNSLLDNQMLAESFGRTARARYEQLFSGVHVGNAYTSLYERALE